MDEKEIRKRKIIKGARRRTRRRMVKKFLRRNILRIWAAAMLTVLICMLIAAIAANQERSGIEISENAGIAEPIKIEKEKLAAVEKEIPQEEPEAEELAGFVFYEIPEEFKRTGGELPRLVQEYAYKKCMSYGVEFETVLAMIEYESGYRWNAKSNVAYGYLQIVPEYHIERMLRLGVTDIENPYENIETGIDYLAELLGKYDGNYSKALTAYNSGEAGAYKKYFSAGKENSPYSDKVTEIADRIRDRQEKTENGR